MRSPEQRAGALGQQVVRGWDEFAHLQGAARGGVIVVGPLAQPAPVERCSPLRARIVIRTSGDHANSGSSTSTIVAPSACSVSKTPSTARRVSSVTPS